MLVRWTRPALTDLIETQRFIAKENPDASSVVAQRLWDAAQSLVSHPQIGRPGRVPGTRELPVPRTPYLIIYRIRQEAVEIIRLWHGRRDYRVEPDTP